MSGKAKVLAAALSLSAAGIAGIQGHEGTVNHVYLDVAGYGTVCTGHLTKLRVGSYVSPALCADYLKGDTAEAQAGVRRLVKVPVTQEQYDALVSLTFNIGSGALAKSTLLKEINAGHCIPASAEWMRWNRAGGVPVKGLTVRRRDESTAWLSGC